MGVCTGRMKGYIFLTCRIFTHRLCQTRRRAPRNAKDCNQGPLGKIPGAPPLPLLVGRDGSPGIKGLALCKAAAHRLCACARVCAGVKKPAVRGAAPGITSSTKRGAGGARGRTMAGARAACGEARREGWGCP